MAALSRSSPFVPIGAPAAPIGAGAGGAGGGGGRGGGGGDKRFDGHDPTPAPEAKKEEEEEEDEENPEADIGSDVWWAYVQTQGCTYDFGRFRRLESEGRRHPMGPPIHTNRYFFFINFIIWS